MQTLEEMLVQKDVITGEILRCLSDMRSKEEVKDVCKELFDAFPECNGIVLMAAYKGDRGERIVYGFDEVEESKSEGLWFDEIDEELCTINSWITDYRPSVWDPETDSLFDSLASVYPYPIEEEIDWDSLELGEKFEILLLKNGEYV